MARISSTRIVPSDVVTVRLDPAPPPVEAGDDLPPAPPMSAGDYELLKLLGRGGMGVVYLARHRALKRNVAYKVLTHLALPDPEALRRFRGEAKVLAKLQHPHIVQVFDSGTCDSTPYLAMEYVSGGSLAKRLRENRSTPREAAALVATIARAVGHAHAQGVIHRDLTPANILLTADGQPKVADFGLARDLGGDERLTRTGLVAGTPHYMAPEQLTDDGPQTPAVDVWAVGVMLYEMLTGTVPFPGSGMQVILANAVRREVVPPRAWQPNLPRDLETVCLKCLQKDPNRRYPSANELADDLQRFLDNRPILARPVGPWEKGSRWCRRNPAVASLTFGITLLLLAGCAVSLSLANWAMGESNRAVAAAWAEAALRQKAEEAFEAETKALKAQVKVREEAEAVTAMLDSLLATVGPGKDAMAELRRRMDRDAAALTTDGRDPLVRARLLFALSNTRRRLGDFEPAVELMEQAFALRTEHLGADHPVARQTARELSYTYIHVRRGEDAIRVVKPVVEAEVATLPSDSAEAIPLLTSLRMAYESAGRDDEERAVGERVLALCQKHYGEDHERTHWIRVNMTGRLRQQKCFDVVIPVFERALARFLTHCGPTSVEVLWTRGVLAECLVANGEPEKALPYLRARYDHDLASAGLGHPFTLRSGECLAAAYERVGKFADAIPVRHALHDHYRSVGDQPAADGHAKRLAENLAALPR